MRIWSISSDPSISSHLPQCCGETLKLSSFSSHPLYHLPKTANVLPTHTLQKWATPDQYHFSLSSLEFQNLISIRCHFFLMQKDPQKSTQKLPLWLHIAKSFIHLSLMLSQQWQEILPEMIWARHLERDQTQKGTHLLLGDTRLWVTSHPQLSHAVLYVLKGS